MKKTNKPPYRIVHLSGLHLTTSSDAKARSELNMFGKLHGMNVAFRKLVHAKPVQESDLVLVTSDVTDRGDIGSWHVFWEAIKGAGLLRRVLVVPGNHDIYCLCTHYQRSLKVYAGNLRYIYCMQMAWSMIFSQITTTTRKRIEGRPWPHLCILLIFHLQVVEIFL